MNLDDLVAIDMHTHAEVSADGHRSLSPELEAAKGAYFKARDAHPTIPEMAAYYRERRMAAVVFTVDAETATGHPPIRNEEVAATCAEHADVLVPFASVDPWKGGAAVRQARRLVEEHGVRGFKFHPSLQAFHPNDRMAYPLYEVIEELGVPALFHTGQTGIGAGVRGGGGIRLRYSNPLDVDDVAADFPDVPIILAHPIHTYQDRGLTFVQGYGLTETSPGALFLRAAESTRKVGSAGTPCFFTDVRVVRLDLNDVAVGEVGEVVIEGPNVMKGYWQLPDATETAFHDDGWFRSGDAAVLDEDGYVTIVDRVKDMFISGGENVYPAEVEQLIYEHRAVAECAVIGVPDERWGEVGRAIVVLREGGTASAEEILELMGGKLAKYKIPKSVVFVDALPRNASGKLLKSRLREKFGSA